MSASEIAGQLDKTQAQPTSNTALPVFTALLKQFLNQLDSIDIKVTRKLRQSVLSQISLSLSSLEERQQLNAWIEGNTDQLMVRIGVVEMQQCIHHAYICTCNFFGPASADEILTKAIKDTEGMSIAREFAPSNLL